MHDDDTPDHAAEFARGESARKPYQRPSLVTYGRVGQLTRGQGASAADGGSGMAMA